MQISRLCLAASLIAIASVRPVVAGEDAGARNGRAQGRPAEAAVACHRVHHGLPAAAG